MKAIRITGIGQVALEPVSLPSPGAQDIILQVRRAGLCHTDYEILNGNYDGSFPVVPGHEVCGEVVELGGGVTSVSRGQHVVIDPLIPCNSCDFCRRGQINLCASFSAYGVSEPGGFAPFMKVRAENCHDIGELSEDIAVLAEPAGCVLHGLGRAITGEVRDTVIFGAGPIGLLMMSALQDLGIDHIHIVDLDEERCAMASRLGAHDTSQSRPDGQFDLAIDCTGQPSVCATLPAHTRDGGTILFFGVCAPSERINISPFEIFRRELKIVGSHSLARDIPAALTFLRRVPHLAANIVTDIVSIQDLLIRLQKPPLAKGMKTQVMFS